MNRTKRYTKRHKKRRKLVVVIVIVFLAIFFMIAGIVVIKQLNMRFSSNTVINGIDVSFLTVEKAEEKLNNEISTEVITFKLLTKNDEEYEEKTVGTDADSFGIKLETDLETLLETQKESGEKNFEVQFNVNEESLNEFLLSIDDLQEENMVEPQDAYLQLNGDKVEIISEVYGFKINFDEAYDFALTQIKEGATNIDFTSLFEIEPEILSTDESLVENQNEINTLLETSITFVFSDATTEVLDGSTISTWIYQDEDGLFYFDESYIEEYVENLAEIVDEKNSSIIFNATDIGEITLSVEDSLRPELDKDAEIELITEAIEAGETCEIELVYDKEFVNNSNSYVELDITRQKVWLYVDDECLMESDCVTGSVADGYSTPTGIFYLTYKTRGATLRGYNSDGSLSYASYVEYWMPFNGGIGFHDASWRSTFGGTIYQSNGSHGCVNMPEDNAEILYEYINESMPIFVYAS